MLTDNDYDKQAENEGRALKLAPSSFFVVRKYTKYKSKGVSHNLPPKKMDVYTLNSIIQEMKETI